MARRQAQTPRRCESHRGRSLARRETASAGRARLDPDCTKICVPTKPGRAPIRYRPPVARPQLPPRRRLRADATPQPAADCRFEPGVHGHSCRQSAGPTGGPATVIGREPGAIHPPPSQLQTRLGLAKIQLHRLAAVHHRHADLGGVTGEPATLPGSCRAGQAAAPPARGSTPVSRRPCDLTWA